MAELSNAHMDAVMAYNDQVLDRLIDCYRQMDEQDRANGCTDDSGALGGIGMLAERAIELGPATTSTLLAMAVRKLAKGADNG